MKFSHFFKREIFISGYFLIYQIVERFFFFAFFLLMVRTLTPEVYGEFAAVFTLINATYIFFEFGLSIHLQRTLATQKENTPELLSEALCLFGISSLLYFIFSITGISRFYPQTRMSIFALVTLVVLMFAVVSNLIAVLSAYRKYKNIFISLIWTRIAIIILFIALIIIRETRLEFLICLLLAGVFSQIIILIRYIGKLQLQLKTPNPRNIFSLATITIPLGLTALFNYLYDKLDVLLISKLLDFSQVAYYNVPYGIYKSTSLVFSFLLVEGLNRISYISRRASAIKTFFYLYSRVLLFICIPLTVIVFFFSDTILLLLYGNTYLPSSQVLRILAIGIVGMALNNLTGVILNGTGRYKTNMYIVLTALLINTILNYLLLQYYGIVISAIITVLTEYFLFVAGTFNIFKSLAK